MKKILKLGFLAIFVVLLTFCFVSCDMLDEGGEWTPRPPSFGPNPAGVYTYWADLEVEGDNVQLFFDENYHEIKITLVKASIGDLVFDSVSIKDATVSFYLYDSGNSGNLFHSDLTQMSSAPQNFAAYVPCMPTTDTWTIEFRSTTSPEKNFDHVISADMVTQIKTWMETN